MRDYRERGVLESLVVAVSQPAGAAAGRYVQDALLDDWHHIWRLVDRDGARVLVCGSAGRLARGVYGALVRIMRLATGAEVEQARAYIDALIAQRRYVEDVWGS